MSTPKLNHPLSKRHQRATLLASAGLGWPRCSPPVALCFAGGRGCCPLAPLPLSYRVPFLASWGNTRRENRLSFYFPKIAGEILGVTVHPSKNPAKDFCSGDLNVRPLVRPCVWCVSGKWFVGPYRTSNRAKSFFI